MPVHAFLGSAACSTPASADLCYLCAGADSLAGDRLGAFNLSMKVRFSCMMHMLLGSASLERECGMLWRVIEHGCPVMCRGMQSASNS